MSQMFAGNEESSLGVGGLNSRPDIAKDMIAMGAGYISAGSDAGFLMNGAIAAAKAFR